MIDQIIDGKYKVVRLVGEGGMGAVYEGLHTGTGRRVAIKVIISPDLAKNSEMVGRFQREARAAGAIDTQHIVQVMDTGRDPTTGHPFMVMEFLQGEDLQQLVQRVGPLPPELALRIVAQACLGLQKAHDAHVVHRDIKPANLFLARRDAGEVIVKVLDFGIAKVKMDQMNSTENAGLTRTGSMLGSPLYMSPEQAKGLKSIDARTDLWSLGAVLHEALSGRTPHHDVDTIGQLILAICSTQPGPVQDFAPWVPPEIAAVVHGALRINVDTRYPSAAAMLDAIRPLLPHGWALHESMLMPLSVEHKSYVAPRLSITGAGDAVVPSYQPGRTGTPVGATTGPAITHGGVSHSQVTPRKSSPAAALAIGGVLALAAASGVGYKMMRRAEQRETKAEIAAAAAAAAQPAPVLQAPAASAPVVTVAEPPRQLNVRLVVVPDNVSVEVDGTKAIAKDGVVEIKGAMGSIHPVKISLGKRETEGEVIVTEAGAIPPKMQLGVVPPKPSKAPDGAHAGPAAGAAPPAAANETKPAKPAAPHIDTKFE